MDVQLRSYRPVLRGIQGSVRNESAHLFGALMLANVVAYAYLMIMARLVSPADYGILVTLTSISYVLSVLMRTFQAWVLKAVSEPQDAGSRRVRAVLSLAVRTLAPLGVVAFAAHWLASDWVASFLRLGAATPVVVLGIYTFSSFIVPIPRGMLLGLNRLYMASLIHLVEPLVRLAVGITFVVWGLGVNGALAGYAVGNGMAFAVGLVALWPLLRRDGQSQPGPRPGGLDRYALVVLAVNTCLMVMASVDQIAVKHFFSEKVAGNYAVAFLLGRVIVMTTLSLGWVVFTRSATLLPDDPRHAQVLVKGLLVIGSIAVALTSGYLLMPTLAVRLMGGSQYGSASSYVGLVGIEMTLFALVYIQAYYHISVRKMQVIWPLGLAAALEFALLWRYHDSIQQILVGLICVMGGLLVCVSALSWWILRPKRQPIGLVVQAPPETAADGT